MSSSRSNIANDIPSINYRVKANDGPVTNYEPQHSIPIGHCDEVQAEEVWNFISENCASHVKIRQNPKCKVAMCVCSNDAISMDCLRPNAALHAFCLDEGDAIAMKLFIESRFGANAFLPLIWVDIWKVKKTDMEVVVYEHITETAHARPPRSSTFLRISK